MTATMKANGQTESEESYKTKTKHKNKPHIALRAVNWTIIQQLQN